MRTLKLLLIIPLAFSCNLKKAKEAQKTYFNFDSAMHFVFDIDENEVLRLIMKEDKNEGDQILYDALIEARPRSLSDSSFLKELTVVGFAKREIKTSYLGELQEIFAEKNHEEILQTACEPIFRDIIVFKKEQEIIGVANICFDCGVSHIIGTTRNTDEFGQSGDYGKLAALLEKNKTVANNGYSK